jgi:hypothetical protein
MITNAQLLLSGTQLLQKSNQKPNIQVQRTKELKYKELVLGEATDAETDADEGVDREVDVAVGRAAVPGVVVPRATAQQSISRFILLLFGSFFNPGTPILWRTFKIAMPMIHTPFPHIAVHVM